VAIKGIGLRSRPGDSSWWLNLWRDLVLFLGELQQCWGKYEISTLWRLNHSRHGSIGAVCCGDVVSRTWYPRIVVAKTVGQ
jgi:hypothetical protein